MPSAALQPYSELIAPQERLAPDVWAERYRILTRDDSAEPGRYRIDRTPYVRGPLSQFADLETRRITCQWSAQTGKSSGLILNAIGWAIDQEPDPILLVQPREVDIAYFFSSRIEPMIRSSPRLARLMRDDSPRDLKNQSIYVAAKDIFIWGGSAQAPASLQSKPICYLFMDEVDRYKAYSGREGNPIKLAQRRQLTYGHRAKLVDTSTPTLKESSYIEAAYLQGDRQRYFVPCPHCGTYQVLQFSRIKFPENERDPDTIRLNGLAWYECESCGARIEEKFRDRMVALGVWCPEGMNVDAGGELHGERPETDHHSYHLWAAYSPWVKWSDIAADFLLAQHDEAALMEFTNQVLGETWTKQMDRVDESEIRAHVSGYPIGTTPDEPQFILGAVDVQKDHFWWLLRAFAPGGESWLVRFGQATTEEDLRTAILGTRYHTANGRGLPVVLVLVDSRYRTREVYQMCARESVWIPCMGHPKSLSVPLGFRHGKWNLDSGFYKDQLFTLIRQSPEDDQWHLPADTPKDYFRQLTAERKVEEIDRSTGYSRSRWVRIRRDNHLLDCETMVLAAADIKQVRHMKTTGQKKRQAPSHGLEVKRFSE